MKRILKTLVMMICAIEIFFTHTISNVVYAKELVIGDAQQINDAAKSLGFKENNTADKSKYKFMSKKINDEKNKYTGVIDKDKERKLNECGVFDEEIMALSDEEKKIIISTPVEDLYAYTSICAYIQDGDYSEDEENIQDHMQIVELNSEQIDKLYAQEYYGADNKFDEEIFGLVTGKKMTYEEKEEDVALSVEGVDRDVVQCSYSGAVDVNSCINNTQISVVNVCEGVSTSTRALTVGSSTYTATGSTSYLKKTLYATMVLDSRYNRNRGYVSITYTNQWIKMPEHRMMDVIVIDFDKNLEYQKSKNTPITVTHKVWEEDYYAKILYNPNQPELLEEKTTGKWVTKKMERVSGLRDSITTRGTVEDGDKFEVNYYWIYIIVPLHNDNQVITEQLEYIRGKNQWTVESHYYTYSNEQVVVQTTLRASRTSETDTFEFSGYYYHQYSSVKIKVNYASVAKTVVAAAGGLIESGGVVTLAVIVDAATGATEFIDVKTNIYMDPAGPSTTDGENCFAVALKFKYK